MRRILKGTTKHNIETGIRLDFYAFVSKNERLETATLSPVAFRIMDTAYASPCAIRALLQGERMEFDELSSSKGRPDTCCIETDQRLTRLLRTLQTRIQRHLSNAKTRLFTDLAHLKSLIRKRMTSLQSQWATQRASFGISSTEDHNIRSAYLINQLIGRELPFAISDSLKRSPVSSHLAFYESPSIIMKYKRTSGDASATLASLNSLHPVLNKSPPGRKASQSKKRRGSSAKGPTQAVIKGPPRPILPANGILRSRTPSNESMTLSSSSGGVHHMNMVNGGLVSTSIGSPEESLLLATVSVEKSIDYSAKSSVESHSGM